MSQRLQRFRNQVEDSAKIWESNVGIPYVASYEKAFDSYKATLDKQKETDKARAEMFVAAASIATGSVLMAASATAAYKVLARRSIFALGRNNLTRTFVKLALASRHNQAATFALGKFLDEAKSAVTKQAQALAGRYMNMNAAVLTGSPLSQYMQVRTILNNNIVCAVKTAQIVEEHSSLSEAEKNAHFAKLYRAPIANEPTVRRTASAGTLAEQIELSMYMSAVLDSDQLIDWPAQVPSYSPYGGGAVMLGKPRSQPITQLPSAPDYPRPRTPRPGLTGAVPAHQSIAITRAGSDVQARTDELCRKIFGHVFYGSSGPFGLFGPPDTRKGAELRAAETVLSKLGEATRPMALQDARG